MHPRSGLVAVATLALLFGPIACGRSNGVVNPEPPPGPPPSDLALERVDGTFEIPVLVTAPAGERNRIFIIEKPGRIRIVKDGALLTAPFLDVTDRTIKGYEQGLLGLAFEPDFASSGRFYVFYTYLDGSERISRFRVSGDPDLALGAEEVLITIPDANEEHNGGMLAFGHDGMLYFSIGDGGGQGDPLTTGQDATDLLGSIMRIDVRGAAGFIVPSSNPLRPPNRPELWCYGLRNPWRFSFDRSTSDLYIADVGQDHHEEINVARAASGGGRGLNFGWSLMEGLTCYGTEDCDPVGLTLPVLDYPHTEGCCIIGGYAYRGTVLPGLQGTYFYSDYCSHWVRSFRYAGGVATEIKQWPGLDPAGNITSFGEDATGELYICTESGSVFRIVAPPS